MIQVGDIVMIDPNFDHPEVRSLKENDLTVFEAQGEVVYIQNTYKLTVSSNGTTEQAIVGKQAEVDWDDGDGSASYPVEWLINVQEFLPEMNNPNRTFRTAKQQQMVSNIAEELFR